MNINNDVYYYYNEYKNLMLPSEQNIKLALSKYEKIFPSSSGPSKTKKNYGPIFAKFFLWPE